MDTLATIFTNRRGWVLLVPFIVSGAALFGIEVPEDALMGFGDKVTEAIMAGLAVWSLFRPKASA